MMLEVIKAQKEVALSLKGQSTFKRQETKICRNTETPTAIQQITLLLSSKHDLYQLSFLF